MTEAKTKLDDDRVRDHLANERTYLAWLRTGVSTMGFGVVIAKLRYLFAAGTIPVSQGTIHASKIGLVFALIGICTVVLSARRFVKVRDQIRKGTYEADALLPLVLGAVITGLGLTILWYLLEPSASQ